MGKQKDEMLIDTSKMSKAEREAMEVAEEARSKGGENRSFVKELFAGNFRLNLVDPYPEQTAVDKNYNIVNDWIVYAGPSAGSHGLAGNPVLIPRTYSMDGDWNYDGVNLTPNMAGTGEYKITAIERIVHRYINRIPLYGSTTNYFTLSSDESAELPVNLGYFMRVTVDNATDSNWHLCAIMEIFRERTYMP